MTQRSRSGILPPEVMVCISAYQASYSPQDLLHLTHSSKTLFDELTRRSGYSSLWRTMCLSALGNISEEEVRKRMERHQRNAEVNSWREEEQLVGESESCSGGPEVLLEEADTATAFAAAAEGESLFMILESESSVETFFDNIVGDDNGALLEGSVDVVGSRRSLSEFSSTVSISKAVVDVADSVRAVNVERSQLCHWRSKPSHPPIIDWYNLLVSVIRKEICHHCLSRGGPEGLKGLLNRPLSKNTPVKGPPHSHSNSHDGPQYHLHRRFWLTTCECCDEDPATTRRRKRFIHSNRHRLPPGCEGCDLRFCTPCRRTLSSPCPTCSAELCPGCFPSTVKVVCSVCRTTACLGCAQMEEETDCCDFVCRECKDVRQDYDYSAWM